MIRIANKDQMLFLLRRGAFGNTPRPFGTYKEAVSSGIERFCVRYRGKVAFQEENYWAPDVPIGNLQNAIDELVAKGAKAELLYFTEWLPVEKLLFSGDVMESDREVELTYSFAKLPPRTALLEEGKFAWEKTANAILRANLDVESYLHIWKLLYQFPGAVVEFAYFNEPVGTLLQQLVVFEVRHY